MELELIFSQGYNDAFYSDIERTANPYDADTDEAYYWDTGWVQGKREGNVR